MAGYVYILASRKGGTLYTGVTSDLSRRVFEHKEKLLGGFTAKYAVDRLVWYEMLETMDDAIVAEKRIKRWRRRWKTELIEGINPEWDDLYQLLSGE
ncbi:MAG: GIY-YIG nuclease family protein [Phyllobacteriaceae bacterium]|nr:GIY-YIG nuclease family protein [Phyllobacteriaceae bacterium]